jgi:serine/threonine-protein kinase
VGISELQAVLPDYEVTSELGRGAMGIVYLGRHRALDRLVAIKELPPSFAADPTVRSRFLTEAKVVAALDHPHVVVIHDFVERDGHLALVMEHLPNGTVWDQFLNQGLAAPRACGLVLATLAGVHHAHDRGIMHRDIKPENLIFTHDGQLKVTDFGIAQVLSGRETMATVEGAIVGTPAYMSPEQAEGRPCGPQADVYASGAMLYEMLTGQLPFPNATDAMSMATARLTNDPVPIESVGPPVPGEIAEVTMRALARAERDRYPTAEAFGVALGEAAANTWGPEWMSEAGTAVRGSEAIEQASRTTRGSSAQAKQAETPAPAPTAETETEAAEPPVVPPPAPARDPQPEPQVQPPQSPEPPRPVAQVPPLAAAQMSAVVPQQRQRVAGANLFDIVPNDMLNLSEVRSPRSPMVPALLAIVGLAAAAFFILVGMDNRVAIPGYDSPAVVQGQAVATSEDPVEVDLAQPFSLGGVSGESVAATYLGIPIGSAPIEAGAVDPGYLRYSGAGEIVLTPESGEPPFTVKASNSPYPTAPFVVAGMVALGGLGSVQSNLRAMRSRRFRIAPYIGLAISGAIAGAGLSVLAMLALGTPTTVSSVIAAAGTGALGSVALGEAYRRWRRRRRLKKVVVATGRR